MKRFLKSLSALVMTAVLLLASSLMASAADDTLQVDGRVSYSVGDTLTYSVCLADTTETITVMEMYIKYDHNFLELDADSCKTPKISNPTLNPAFDSDTVYMSWLNVTDGVEFSQKAVLLSVDFKVLKAGSTNIQFWIEEMCSNDLTYIKTYTLTAEYSENGQVVKDNVPPLIVDDPDFMADNQGQFLNFEDGKGEKNSDAGDNHIAATGARSNNGGNGGDAANNAGNNNNNANAAQAVTDSNGNVAVTNSRGEIQPTDAQGSYLDDNGNVLSTDEKGNYISKDGSIYQAAPADEPQKSFDVGPVIIIIAIAIIAVAIVVIIILRNRNAKKEEKAPAEDGKLSTDGEPDEAKPDNAASNDEDDNE